MICNECETVAHCMAHGCIPKQPYSQIKNDTCTTKENPHAIARKAERHDGAGDCGSHELAPSQRQGVTKSHA